jgi:transposase
MPTSPASVRWRDRGGSLRSEEWAALEPLIEACRPKGKTPPHELRRTVEAIFWRHQNGAKWRAVPAELGPWWRAAQLFIRWSRLGAWERLLAAARARGIELGVAFLDGTSVRAHQKAAGAAKKGDLALSGTCVRRLADLAAAMAARPA